MSMSKNIFEAAINGNLEDVKYFINEKGVDVDTRNSLGETALMKACANGHQPIIEFLVDKGANLDVVDRFGYSALLWSVDRHTLGLAAIKYLVEHGANVNVQERRKGYTPLHWAADYGDFELAKYLVDRGAYVNAKTKDDLKPVDLAASKNYTNLLDFFIDEQGVRFDIFEAAQKGYTGAVTYFIEQKHKAASATDHAGWSVLHRAAYGGSLKTVQYLIQKKGVNVNAVNPKRTPFTALHGASEKGHTDIAEYLVEKGANVALKDHFGRTALYWAADNGHLEIVKYLVESCKMDVNERDSDGHSILHASSWFGSYNLVVYLVEKRNMYVNLRDNAGNTPLIETIRKGNLNIFRYLLDEKLADFRIATHSGVTCLHEAAIRGYISVVKKLVEKGADINAKESNGRTPLYWAADGSSETGGHLNVVRYFVDEKKADVRQKDNYGNTLLHAAEWYNSLDVVKYLVDEKGLDIYAKDNDGNTPLSEAKERGRQEIVKYFESRGARLRRSLGRVKRASVETVATNSAYRHYSIINGLANCARNSISGFLPSSVKPMGTTSIIGPEFNLAFFNTFLVLLSVGYRRLFGSSSEYTCTDYEKLLSPTQLIERRMDPNATMAVFSLGKVFEEED